MIHFYKGLTDLDKYFIDVCLVNIYHNYLNNEAECTEQQYRLAEFLEDVLIKISSRNDGLLFDVLKNAFIINTEELFK